MSKQKQQYQVIVHQTSELTYQIPATSAGAARRRWEKHQEPGKPDEDLLRTKLVRMIGPDGNEISEKKRKPSKGIKPWNEDRAEWALEAIETFEGATGVDREDAFCDLLCDLMHLAQREGIDFDHELERGLHHYEYEKDHQD